MAFIRERDGKFSVVYKIKDDKGKVHQNLCGSMSGSMDIMNGESLPMMEILD